MENFTLTVPQPIQEGSGAGGESKKFLGLGQPNLGSGITDRDALVRRWHGLSGLELFPEAR